MAIELYSLPRCSVCRRLPMNLRGWLMFKTRGPEFTFRDYAETMISEFDGAACSLGCLERAAGAHAETLNAQRLGDQPDALVSRI